MTAAAIFTSQFILVAALGLQSLNVNNGHRLLAALTSLVICVTTLASTELTFMHDPLNLIKAVAFIAGSVSGILAGMSAHPWLARHIGKRSHLDSTPPHRMPTAPPRRPAHWEDAT